MRRRWLGAGLLVVVACGGKSSQSESTDTPSGGAAGGSIEPGAGRAGQTAAAGATAGGRAASSGGSSAGTTAGKSNAGASSGGASQAGDAGSSVECTPGQVRCETVREHCDDDGTWQKESFVCAVDITGSQESPVACAVKSDGQMTCFGPSSDYFSPKLIANAPTAKWSKLFLTDDLGDASDHQLCGVRQSGDGECWGIDVDRRSIGGSKLVASSSDGLCLVGPDGNWSCPVDLGIVGQKDAGTDRVLDLQMRSSMLFGLKVDGSVLAPYPQYMLAGSYTRISAGNSELCGLRADHTLACAVHAVPSELASQRFLDLAVDYWGAVCLIRDDQTIVCDPLGSGSFDTVPPEGQFTQLTIISGATLCAIRVDGSIACAGSNGVEPPVGW